MDAIILYDSSLVRISCFLITVGSCFLLASVVTKQHFASPVHCWCICPSCQHLCNIIWLWELEEASFHRQKGIASVRAWFQLLFLGAASSFQNDCAMASGRQDLIKTRKSTGLHEMWKCLVQLQLSRRLPGKYLHNFGTTVHYLRVLQNCVFFLTSLHVNWCLRLFSPPTNNPRSTASQTKIYLKRELRRAPGNQHATIKYQCNVYSLWTFYCIIYIYIKGNFLFSVLALIRH